MKTHVALVIKNKNNDILFIKRSMKKKTLPGAWSFPSGTVEDNEDIYKTAIREAKEELNIKIKTSKIITTYDLPEFSVHLAFILCEIEKGNPVIKEPDEIDKIEWMKFEEFFKRFSDSEIGHGLIWLRKNPEIWNKI
ncbi:MAG: NUDIX hydrolase [Nanoarchaeota archaeon]